jgi:hypothetical protein
MALIDLKRLTVLIGEQVYRTRSAIVDTADVRKGDVVIIGATGEGYLQPATADASRNVFLGVSLEDVEIGKRCDFVVPPFDARVFLTESQTIGVGDPITTGTITIDGVTTPGFVKELTVPAVSAGANPTKAEFDALVAYTLQRIGKAISAVSTNADESKVVKVRFE